MNIFKNKFLLMTIFSSFVFNGLVFPQHKKLFVGTNGDDLNSGLSAGQPLKTINAAIGRAEPGDTVFVLPGIYAEIIKFDAKNGLPEKPICVKGLAENGNDFPVIDGGANVPTIELTNYWMLISNSSWIEFSELKFQNGWVDLILINNSSYISINECIFYGGRRVIYATGEQTHHILIENCFWDQGGEFLWKVENDSAGVDAWTSMHHERMSYFNGSIIDFRGTGGSIVIRNNEFINTFNAVRWRGQEGGYDSNIEIYSNKISHARDNDFEPETYSYNLHIYHNVLHNIHRTLSVDNLFGGLVYFYGNVITTDSDHWTQEVCENVWKVYGSERNLDYPLYIFNNSYYGCQNAFRVDRGKAILTKHFNNAYQFILDGKWILDKWDSTLEFDYDISNKKWADNMILNNQEQHGKIAEINYVNPAEQDLRLQESSPGIDAGKVMHFPELGWMQSYSGKAPDVGAYENGNLVDGPPFRFMIPPESKIGYKEKPRIVRHYVEGNKLILYFSDKLDTSLDICNSIKIFLNNKEIEISSVLYKDDYSIAIETVGELTTQNLAVKFIKLFKSINGETATTWASTIKVIK